MSLKEGTPKLTDAMLRNIEWRYPLAQKYVFESIPSMDVLLNDVVKYAAELYPGMSISGNARFDMEITENDRTLGMLNMKRLTLGEAAEVMRAWAGKEAFTTQYWPEGSSLEFYSKDKDHQRSIEIGSMFQMVGSNTPYVVIKMWPKSREHNMALYSMASKLHNDYPKDVPSPKKPAGY